MWNRTTLSEMSLSLSEGARSAGDRASVGGETGLITQTNLAHVTWPRELTPRSPRDRRGDTLPPNWITIS